MEVTALVSVPFVKIPLEVGEKLKAIERVTEMTRNLAEREIGANSLMLIIGGGTLCNAAGFIAAMWNGMESIIIPTNFTAIGDVAIGSLHMVNVGHDKNRLQLYRDPLAVVLDPRFIASLPESERRNGLAETVKHAIAQDGVLFDQLELHVANGTLFHDVPLFDFALRTAQLKDELMGIDPFGVHTQNVFLYGHVLAHAIEPATNHAMSHGEAVSLWILGELAFFHAPSSEIFSRVRALLSRIGLPTQMPSSLSVAKVMEQLAHTMTSRGTLLIPHVKEIGKLHRADDGRHTLEFDRDAITEALGAITA